MGMSRIAERELVLLKIRAPPGPTRTEVMQLIDIFRARVVDVSDRSLTIAVTGDAGKVKSWGTLRRCAEIHLVLCLAGAERLEASRMLDHLPTIVLDYQPITSS